MNQHIETDKYRKPKMWTKIVVKARLVKTIFLVSEGSRRQMRLKTGYIPKQQKIAIKLPS